MGGKEKIEAFEAMKLKELSWMIMESGELDEASNSTSIFSSENSINSIESFSSELLEDASSSSTSTSTSNLSLSSSSSSSSGPLYELSELMVNLPIKRGLSKFYNGKSQSFTSLGSAKRLEDLAKKVNDNICQRKKMKSCKSYGGGLDAQRTSYSHSPKPLIAKKTSKASFLSPISKRTNGLF